MPRKIIQVATTCKAPYDNERSGRDPAEAFHVVALCDDGTVWRILPDSYNAEWAPLPAIPQDVPTQQESGAPMLKPLTVEPRAGVVAAHLADHIRRFEVNVWEGCGLARQVRAMPCSGMRGQAGKLDVLLFTSAGRTLITLRDAAGSWCSLVVAQHSDEATMAIHSRCIDDATLCEWLPYVTNHWAGVQDDPTVTCNLGGGLL